MPNEATGTAGLPLLVVLATTLAGCAAIARQDIRTASDFHATDTGFTFRVPTSTNSQEDSVRAEHQRLLVMQQFADTNHVCPGGYDVVSREVTRKPPSMLGVRTIGDITYAAKCR